MVCSSTRLSENRIMPNDDAEDDFKLENGSCMPERNANADNIIQSVFISRS